MRKRRSPEFIDTIAGLREKGWSCARIGKKLGLSPSAISYYCLKFGVETPNPARSWDAIKGPATMMRGDHVVRRFTPDEDAKLLEMESRGATIATIARALGRCHNSIAERLMTLARAEERRAL